MQSPRTLDDLLNDARAFPRTDLDEEEEEWISRRRLAEDYADAVRRGRGGGGFPHPALGPASLGLPVSPAPGPATAAAAGSAGPGRPGPVPRRERATRELRALSAWAIRGPRAAEHIAGLAASHQIDDDSALVFACLLYLADRDDEAEFLWQFAAGAGKPASAECLYLLHTTRGELRQARHWAHQAADLDSPDDEVPPHRPVPLGTVRREPKPLTSLMLLRVWRALRGQDAGASLSISTFHAAAGTLSRALTTAIQGLKAEPELALLSWPDRTLAAQMQECLTS